METKIFNFKARWLLVPLVLMTLGVGNVWGTSATWELVESEPADWSGEYLIVYNGYCFNGSLTSGFDQHTPVEVTVSNKKITLDDSYALTVAVSGTKYSLQTSTGYYIGRNANSNGMDASTTWSTNYTVVFNTWNSTNKTIRIVGNGGRAVGRNGNSWRFYSTSNAYVNVQMFKKAASCDYKVTVTKSDASNGSFTLKAGSVSGTTINNSGTVDNCDANATIVVIPSPNSHYHVSGVSASNNTSLSGPDGSGNYTITYTKGSNISTTIGVTFAADPTYTVTWVAGSNPSFSTQTNYAGTALTDPGTPSPASYCPGGKVFVGWTETPIDGEGEEPADLFTSVSGKSIPVGGTTYYAVFATKGEGGGDVTDVINNSVTTSNLGSTGTSTWVNVWETSAMTSGAKYKIRSMGINKASNYALQWNSNGYLFCSSAPSAGLKLKSITIKTLATKNIGLYGSTSVYTDKASSTSLSTLSATTSGATYALTSEQLANNYTCVGINGAASSTQIVSISITYSGGTSYSNYATSCCTELGSINGSNCRT